MSVAYISDAELAGLWHRLGRTEDIGLALQALGVANRAAFMLAYAANHEDARTMDAPDFADLEPAPIPARDWSLLTWADNLLYNCVTNAGTDFAPARFAAVVRDAAARVDADERAPDADGESDATRFTGTVRGSINTAFVDVVGGRVVRVRLDRMSFEATPCDDISDDDGNDGLPNADAILDHVLDQEWPVWDLDA